MPFSTPPAGETDAAATGRAQESTPTSKKELHMGSARRHEPASSSSSSSSATTPRVDHAHPPRSLRLHVGVFSKHKGVRYHPDGRVVTCRFCEILRVRDEQFLYEDASIVVFRPLHPIVPSHILIVPRAHIRNVNQLTVDHVDLLRRMRAVADKVIHSQQCDTALQADLPSKTPRDEPKSPNDVSVDDFPGLTMSDLEDEPSDHSNSDVRFAFHVPPFNSIDHVHMHAFRGPTGYFGRIKYRTESWWCRSYDEVLARLENGTHHHQLQHQHSHNNAQPPEPTTARTLDRAPHSSRVRAR